MGLEKVAKRELQRGDLGKKWQEEAKQEEWDEKVAKGVEESLT